MQAHIFLLFVAWQDRVKKDLRTCLFQVCFYWKHFNISISVAYIAIYLGIYFYLLLDEVRSKSRLEY